MKGKGGAVIKKMTGSHTASRKILYVIAACVALITLIVYLPALRNDFVNWDDDGNVYDNLHIRSLGASFFRWAISDTSLSFWQPLNWTTFALDYAIWGLNPTGYHLTNVLLHMVNTFLVVYLIVRLLQVANRRESRPETVPLADERSALITGGVAGILFGIHPLHVESVAWVTGRTDLLCTLFFLLSVLSYDRHVEFVGRKGSSPLSRWYFLSLAMFALSLSSKPLAVVLPAVLLLLDWYPFERMRSLKSSGFVIAEKIPFAVLSLGVSAVTVIAERKASLIASVKDVSLLTRIVVMCKALALYLWKTMVPIHLVPLYPYPDAVSVFSFEYLASLAVVIVIAAASVRLAGRHKVIPAVILFFLFTLLPVLGLVKVRSVFMADRYMYLPSIGLFLLAGLAAARAWGTTGAVKQRAMTVRRGTAAGFLAICFALSYLTVQQVAVWKDSISLWNYIIGKEPNRIAYAYTNRGNAFRELGQSERALEDFNMAIRLEPREYLAYNNRGTLFMERGDYEKAIEDYTAAISLKENFASALNNRGYVFQQIGMTDRAIEDYTAAITQEPASKVAYTAFTNRGVAFAARKVFDRAIDDLSAAIALNPSNADAYTSRGFVLKEAGRIDEAVKDFNLAIALNSSSADAYLNRGVVFEREGQLEHAAEDYGRAIALNPSDFLAYSNRGIVFSRMGRTSEAVEDFSRAIELNPGFSSAYLERGDLYMKEGRTDLAAQDYRSACERGSEPGCKALKGIRGF